MSLGSADVNAARGRWRPRSTGVPFALDAWLLLAVATLVVLILVGIFLFLGLSGLRAFREISLTSFLFGTNWNPSAYGEPSWGIASLLMGSLLICLLSLLVAVPLGLATAVYLSELAPPRVREVLKPVIEMIAGIPSVVLGLLGLIVLAPLVARVFGLSNGLNALTAALLVAFSALPTVASICEDALSNVPRRYREASLALGATRWQTIRSIVIPSARSGIVAGVMLGLGRAIGETIIVLMVAGNSLAFPRGPFDAVRPVTANIAIEIKEAVVGSLHWHALFALGFTLFLITFLVNLAADILIHRSNGLHE